MSAHIHGCRCLACVKRREAVLLAEVRAATYEADEMLAVICAVEWAGDPTHHTCTRCGASKGSGHKPDCRLAAVLKRRREAPCP